MRVQVLQWAAWAPGLEAQSSWAAWCSRPTPLSVEGVPDVSFLPPLQRRRCGRLSRMMLRVAFDCLPREDVPRVPTVFASRYGDLTTTVGLLESLARQQPLAANRFSHSVHNTQAALFSIVAANRHASTAIAAGRDTFPCAFLEALAVLRRGRVESVSLVIGDEPLPPVFKEFTDDPVAAYAAAFLLTRADQGRGGISLDLCVGKPNAEPSWPQAIEFLRWFLSEEPSLTLGAAQRHWQWTRAQRTKAVASSR